MALLNTTKLTPSRGVFLKIGGGDLLPCPRTKLLPTWSLSTSFLTRDWAFTRRLKAWAPQRQPTPGLPGELCLQSRGWGRRLASPPEETAWLELWPYSTQELLWFITYWEEWGRLAEVSFWGSRDDPKSSREVFSRLREVTVFGLLSHRHGAAWSYVRSSVIVNIVQIMNVRKLSFKGFKCFLNSGVHVAGNHQAH